MKQKIMVYLKTNYKSIILIMILVIVNAFTAFKMSRANISEFVQKYSTLLIIVFTLIEILLFLITNSMLKRQKPIEKIFLALIIPIGLFYMILIPIGRIPDEENHAKRAYEISEGHIISSRNSDNVGGQVLNKKLAEINKYIDYKSYKEAFKPDKKIEKKFLTFPNTSLYSFINYVPQSLGILMGKLLHLPLIFQLYLARIANFIVWILLMYLALKLIPYKKICVFSFLFIPIMLQEAVSLSADALTNGISFFLISYALYLKEKKDNINKKDTIIMALSTIVLAMCKIVYLPLCLIVFIIPYNKFYTKKKKYIKIGLLASIVVLLSLIWLKISSSYLVEYYNPGVDSPMQVSYILHNPISYIVYCFNTLYELFDLWVYQLLGGSLCWLDVQLSCFYIYIMIFLFIYILLFDGSKKISGKDKFLSGIIIFGTIMLIFTSLYVQWTPVANRIIEGIQGRYYIPLLLPLALVSNFSKTSGEKNLNLKIITYLLIFFNIYALMAIFFHHVG